MYILLHRLIIRIHIKQNPNPLPHKLLNHPLKPHFHTLPQQEPPLTKHNKHKNIKIRYNKTYKQKQNIHK